LNSKRYLIPYCFNQSARNLEKIDTSEHYKNVGEFVSKVNTFEFFVNQMIERIILESEASFPNKVMLDGIITSIEEQSISKRCHYLILLILMKDIDADKKADMVSKLNLFANYYNKQLRDTRDFIAHNMTMTAFSPLDKTSASMIIPSRRTRGKITHLKESDIMSKNADLVPIIEDFSKLVSIFFTIFPHGSIDFTKLNLPF